MMLTIVLTVATLLTISGPDRGASNLPAQAASAELRTSRGRSCHICVVRSKHGVIDTINTLPVVWPVVSLLTCALNVLRGLEVLAACRGLLAFISRYG